MSDKVGILIQSIATFVTGFIVAFTRGWQLTLVLCSVFPVLGTALMIFGKTIAKGQGAGSDHYAEAGSVAQEVISSIRTVVSFGGQKRELQRYQDKLEGAEKEGIKTGWINGASIGIVWVCIFSTYSLGLWYGSTLISPDYPASQVINVFFR